MFRITLEDLRYRARQFLIAVVGAGLLFSMSLLLSGMAAGFSVEIDKTVAAMGAQSWVVAAKSPGRVGGLVPIPAADVAAVAAEPGVRRAAPVYVVTQPVQIGTTSTKTVNLVGFRPGAGLGGPGALTSGRSVDGPGQAVVDSALGLGLNGRFSVAGRSFRVVGVVSARTLFGGIPNAYITLGDLQRVVFGGNRLVGAVLVTGTPKSLPPGLVTYTAAQIEAASLTQMASGVSSINSSRIFMWLIAGIIVAALVYVTALERTRDFAVLKAVGASTGGLFVGLAAQAVMVSLAAAAIGAVLSNFMTGIFSQPVYIPASAFIILPVSAVVVGLLASLAALRRASAVSPAAAFAGA